MSFGRNSNLPPGVTNRMIEEQYNPGDCVCCGHDAEDCICSECEICGETGNPACYRSHGIKYNRQQLIGQAKRRIALAEESIQEDGLYLHYLESDEAKEDFNEH